jgi:hypothetical protein
MQAYLSTTLASLGPVKEEFRGRKDGQDQSGHLNPTAQIICGLRWPESQGSWRLYFEGYQLCFSQQEGMR